jgi:hypothetical protein
MKDSQFRAIQYFWAENDSLRKTDFNTFCTVGLHNRPRLSIFVHRDHDVPKGFECAPITGCRGHTADLAEGQAEKPIRNNCKMYSTCWSAFAMPEPGQNRESENRSNGQYPEAKDLQSAVRSEIGKPVPFSETQFRFNRDIVGCRSCSKNSPDLRWSTATRID